MQSDAERAAPIIAVFAILNFILAGLCALWLALMTALLVYGIGFSGDRGKDLAAGVLGSAALALPGLLGLGVYLVAGVGLLRQRAWGFYFHCAGAVLTAFTCVGLVYTVLAFVFAFQPHFSGVFFPAADHAVRRRRRQRESWDDV